MGSREREDSSAHLHRRHSSPGIIRTDSYASMSHPPHDDFRTDSYASMVHLPRGDVPTFEALPTRHQVLEQKISDLDIEIGKLATENRRLLATHGVLRQDIAIAKHEVQLIDAQNSEFMAEKEKQFRTEMDKIEKMESELRAAEPIRIQLQKAREEARNLVSLQHELISRVQQMSHELDIASLEAQQITPLIAELDSLKQEYQHCRSTYDRDMKLYSDHLESLRVMEMNYTEMSKEASKLKERLSNAKNPDARAVSGDPAQFNGRFNVWNNASGQNGYVQAGPRPGPLLGGRNLVATGAETKFPHSGWYSAAPYGSVIANDGAMFSYDPSRAYDPAAAAYHSHVPSAASGRIGQAGYGDPKMQRRASGVDAPVGAYDPLKMRSKGH